VTENRHQRVSELFLAAQELPPDQRNDFLRAECAMDLQLRQDVESLLTQDTQAREMFPDEGLTAAARVSEEPSDVGRQVGHYEILEKIGRGGMGQVYRARDKKLRRDVALKRPAPGHETDPQFYRRFMREARTASKLSHASIVPIFEVLEDKGVPWLAMQLIKGQDLRRVLGERGPLSVRHILRHGMELAEGLQAAHNVHIIHRDINPKNIMINQEEHALLLDFGLARYFIPPEDASQASTHSFGLTKPGSRVGTPAYMSPEQALGRPLDARSDIFSLGAVLYEMCTGKAAFAADSEAEILDLILHRWPAPIASLNPEIPEELQRIIRKAMAKDPQERYQETRDLLVDLKAVKGRYQHDEFENLHPPPPPAPRPWWLRFPSIALAGTALAATVVAWLIVQIAQAPLLQDLTGDPDTVAERQLPAGGYYRRGLHYLENTESLRSLDDAIQLLHRATKAQPDFVPAWAVLGEAYWVRYVRWGHDFASKEEAVAAVNKAFELSSDLPEVHNARGYGLFAQGELVAAKDELLKAVQDKPDFDRAWANLGAVHQSLGEYSEGLDALETAIRLRPEHFRHHLLLGFFRYQFGEYDAAMEAYQKAIDLKPDSFTSRINLAAAFLETGQPEEAIEALLSSLEIEETSSARDNLGTSYFHLKDYEQAAHNYRRATELEPAKALIWANLGDTLKVQGKREEARGAYLKAVALALEQVARAPLDAPAHRRLGLYCAKAGDEDCALREGHRAVEMEPERAESAFRLGIIYCLLDRQEDSLDWLEKAVRLGLSKAVIDNAPDLSILNEHPRFSRLLDLAS